MKSSLQQSSQQVRTQEDKLLPPSRKPSKRLLESDLLLNKVCKLPSLYSKDRFQKDYQQHQKLRKSIARYHQPLDRDVAPQPVVSQSLNQSLIHSSSPHPDNKRAARLPTNLNVSQQETSLHELSYSARGHMPLPILTAKKRKKLVYLSIVIQQLQLIQDPYTYYLDKKNIEYFVEYQLGPKRGQIKFNDIFQEDKIKIKVLYKMKNPAKKVNQMRFNLWISKSNNQIQHVGEFVFDIDQLQSQQPNSRFKGTVKSILTLPVEKKYLQGQSVSSQEKGQAMIGVVVKTLHKKKGKEKQMKTMPNSVTNANSDSEYKNLENFNNDNIAIQPSNNNRSPRAQTTDPFNQLAQ